MRYLDTQKSVIISSPAGSGKTEKLARRYIALIREGVDVERILAITFTDKAATEMKERILRILKDEDEETFKKVIGRLSLMRISTIHSFCGSIIRRFAFEVGIDPNYRIEDAIDSTIAWDEIFDEVLMNSGDGKGLLIKLLAETGFRGRKYLKDVMRYLFDNRPFSLEADAPPLRYPLLLDELMIWPGAMESIEDYKEILLEPHIDKIRSIKDRFLTRNGEPRRRPPKDLSGIKDYPQWAERMYNLWMAKNMNDALVRSDRLMQVFRRAILRYEDMKKKKGFLDYSDLEYITYNLLTKNPEWANILYAFDEKIDHILVDEFQDTNEFQWAIIDKLTEEWRSGLGAKRERGIKPTIFLVGDEKQSIFLFRGANVEVFHRARERLGEWLGDEFCYEESRENFRSLPAIIEFTNYIFSRVMSSENDTPAWKTAYTPFYPCRKDTTNSGRGRVELIIHDNEYNGISDARNAEAEIISKRILSIVDNMEISSRRGGRCRFEDIAILLRKRTHLQRYEDVLRRYGIRFVTVKGIGFYQEPEIAILRALIYFLSTPTDDYSLYTLLKSPFFMVNEASISGLINRGGDSLFSKLKSAPRLSKKMQKAVESLEEWLSMASRVPISELIEHALITTGAWRYLYEPQRRANIKKFIRITEGLEADGKSILKIRDFLERTYHRDEEPKANVNTEGMDAVKIITIHSAKGLEFPVVFIPALEEPFRTRIDENLVYEKDGRFYFKSITETSLRKGDEDFRTHHEKEREEEKRLLYVAMTRAKDALFLIGRWDETERGSFFGFIRDAIGIRKEGDVFMADVDIEGFRIVDNRDVENAHTTIHPYREKDTSTIPRLTPLPEIKPMRWVTVTEVIDIRSRHGKGWLVIGEVFHRLFEEVSRGLIEEDGIIKRAEVILEDEGIINEREEVLLMIKDNISLLKDKGIWQEVILPRKGSFSELPFIMEMDGVVYSGRIDRVIRFNDGYAIYDYKTFPVKEEEIEHLLKEYAPQLAIYKEAIRRIFNTDSIKTYIVFTHIGKIEEVGY